MAPECFERKSCYVLLFGHVINHSVFPDPGTPSARTKRLSQSDWLLLETLDTRCQRPLHTGRFLTMHKRRRKRLITRSLTQDHALLDDIHHGQVQVSAQESLKSCEGFISVTSPLSQSAFACLDQRFRIRSHFRSLGIST